MRRVLVTAVITAGLLAACGSSGSSAGDKPSTTSSSTSTTSTTTLPPGVVNGQTAWVDATARWKLLAPTTFTTTPEVAAEDLAARLRGGDTSETGTVAVVSVQRGEPAVVVIRETGLPDDSVYSVDFEITLEPGDEGWAVSKARAQYSCTRGVDETNHDLCL